MTGPLLEAVRVDQQLTPGALWLGYFAIGGNHSLDEINDYLLGRRDFTPLQHDMLAQALNDHATELGGNHPAPYSAP